MKAKIGRKSLAKAYLFLITSILLVYALSKVPLTKSQVGPFTITERTEYDILTNKVYIEITELTGQDQTVDIRNIFLRHSLTEQISYEDVLMLQGYSVDDYGWANVSIGKYVMSETNCATENTTKICKTYYKSDKGETICESVGEGSDEKLITCDYMLPDKSVLKKQWQVIDSHTEYDYLSMPTVKKNTTTDEKKIEQKQEGIPLPKNSKVQLKFLVKHPLFGPDFSVPSDVNKYNISACSQYGCAELDPIWWDENYNYKRIYNFYNPTATDSWFPILVNMTPLTNFNSDLSDFRSVDSIEINEHKYNYEFKDSSGTYTLFHFKPNSTGIKANKNYTSYIYYSYASAINNSQPKNVWNVTGHWTLDDDTVKDDTLTYNLTATGTPQFITNSSCAFGNCYGFQDSTGIFLGTGSINSGSSYNFTLSGWILMKAYDTTERGYIFWANSGGTPRLFMIESSANGKIACGLDTKAVSTQVLGLNKWYYITCVLNGTTVDNSAWTLYINGVVNSSDKCSPPWCGAGDAPFRIGSGFGAAYGTANGLVDEVTLINASLTTDQVMAEYQSYNTSNFFLGTGELIYYNNETGGRAAIAQGIQDALGNNTLIYTDQQIYTRNLTNGQQLGRFDKVAVYGSQRWAFNYITTGESFTNIRNMTPVLYVWEMQNVSLAYTRTAVNNFITQTKQ